MSSWSRCVLSSIFGLLWAAACEPTLEQATTPKVGAGAEKTGSTDAGTQPVNNTKPDAGQTTDAEPPKNTNFTPFAKLGKNCTAGMATTPATQLGALSFIPCQSGEADCHELQPEKSTSTAPFSSDFAPTISVQTMLDGSGKVVRTLIEYNGADALSVPNQTPYLAVVYDISGKPLAGWRNAGDLEDPNIEAPQSCTLTVGLTEAGALLLATPSNASGVVWATTDLNVNPATVEFAPLDTQMLSAGILRTAGQVAGLMQGDGKLYRFDLASKKVTSSYGPNQKLYLQTIAGDDLIASAESGASPHYRLQPSGSFEKYDITGSFLRGDANRLAWVTTVSGGLEVWTAARNGTTVTGSAKRVAQITGQRDVYAATMGDSIYALQLSPANDAPDTVGFEIIFVDLAAGTVRKRAIGLDPSDNILIANTSQHTWFGVGPLDDVATQFWQIRRFGLGGGCRGTVKACSALAATECNTLIGCESTPQCLGKPTATCNYTDRAQCEQNSCEFNTATSKCAAPTACPTLNRRTGEAECKAVQGCTYHPCSGTAVACENLPAQQCSSQPGCSWQ